MSKRIALVTGAGTGIGRACAVALADLARDTRRSANALGHTEAQEKPLLEAEG